jgi:DNA (cytosine-5)-methyltransferase 1
MRELSLFSGAGGGLLGTKLLDWKCIGYVEFEDYCQRVIAARIRDGYLDDAPIFGDIRTFIGDGYASAYTGLVDVITAGFPCQPFSVAGKQLAGDDPKNMWPATCEVVRIVRPKHVLLENVAALIANPYFGRILGDLAALGYDCRWECISAQQLGAPHRRDRVWIVGDSNGEGESTESEHDETPGVPKLVPNPDGYGLRAEQEQESERGLQTESDAYSQTRVWRDTKPGVCRLVDGMAPGLVGRLKAIGNGQVPAVVRCAWDRLAQGCSQTQ